VPYEINLPFWSDGAKKTRWFSISNTTDKLTFNPTNAWQTPTGAVWIKHFEMQMTNGDPASVRRLETRFIVRNTNGVYGVTYRWTNETSAGLVPEEGMDEPLAINDGGTVRTQMWHYPARSECLVCHTPAAGWVLGFNTPQMNRDMTYGTVTTNQIAALANAGYLDSLPAPPHSFMALAAPDDASASQEFRVRSYLAANCSQCHRPGGTAIANFDTRISTATDDANLIDDALIDNLGDAANRTLVPNSPEHSAILQRMSFEARSKCRRWPQTSLTRQAPICCGRLSLATWQHARISLNGRPRISANRFRPKPRPPPTRTAMAHRICWNSLREPIRPKAATPGGFKWLPTRTA
jgi:mono/diheme cytochrome c family protein